MGGPPGVQLMQSLGNYTILFCIFVTGFLASRVFVKTGLATRVVIDLVRLSRGHISTLLLLLLGASTLLSSFIPNTVTVLTLIPVLRIINRQYRSLETGPGQLSTPIVMSVIYGANIGGMASIIGSPANAVLLGFLPIIEQRYGTTIAGREQINFLSWLAFGIPTAAVLLAIAWLLIAVLLVPKKLKRAELDFSDLERERGSAGLRTAGLWYSVVLFGVWIVLSVLQTFIPPLTVSIAVVSVVVTLVAAGVVFFWQIPTGFRRSEPLLRIRDCYTGLPVKGFLLALFAVLFSAVLMFFDIPEAIGAQIMRLDLSSLAGTLLLYLVLALIVTFLTEFLSNTTVALTFFPLVYVLAVTLDLRPLTALLLVSLSTTCAFMTPIATPVNALAYGSVSHVSLRKMVLLGLLMNVISASWLSWAVNTIVPYVMSR